MDDLTTRTLPAGEMTPARAYAALRTKTPWRTSYLIEMREPDEHGEQRSVIGFLVKNEAAYAAATDGVREIANTAATLAAAPLRADLPVGGADDVAALLLAEAALPALGIAPRPEMPFAGREMQDIASVAFDHVAGTITLSSSNANTVARLARALEEAPALADLPAAGGARPEHVTEQPPAPAFAKQLVRASLRLGSGGIKRLALGRTFASPVRGADMFEVYRALQAAAPMRYHFFVELAASPMFAAFAVAAAGRRAVRLSASNGAEPLAKEMVAFLSTEESCGAPAKEALDVWRDVATFPLGMKGGAIARARPGGQVDVVRADAFVVLEDEQLQTLGVADVVAGRSAEAHTEAAAAEAAGALAAIRHAHDIAAVREAAKAATDPEAPQA